MRSLKSSASQILIVGATAKSVPYLRRITDVITDIKSGGNMNDLKVTLHCGIEVDFTGKLDSPFNFIGSYSDMLNKCKQSNNWEIQQSAKIEIENRAIKHAHKALSDYIMRARMADEAVKLLMNKIAWGI